MSQLSYERANALLRYDPASGRFWRKSSRGGRKAGTEAGHLQKFEDGSVRRVLRIDGTLYLAARIAWLLMTGEHPEREVDHENCDSADNAWTNLRQATRSQNQRNVAPTRRNTSGFKGVSFDRHTNRWVARIREPHGPYRNLGRYDTPEQAAAAYAKAAGEWHGEFKRLA